MRKSRKGKSKKEEEDKKLLKIDTTGDGKVDALIVPLPADSLLAKRVAPPRAGQAPRLPATAPPLPVGLVACPHRKTLAASQLPPAVATTSRVSWYRTLTNGRPAFVPGPSRR